MASIDIEVSALVAPISDDNPTGIDLRNDSDGTASLRAIKEARAKASEIERQILGPSLGSSDGANTQDQPKTLEQAMAHWRTVANLSQRVLTEQSKDLEVVAFLLEAVVRTDGFAGLEAGFRLARELVENYWDNLYPQPDEEGLATRTLPLARLNGDGSEGLLIGPIRAIPIVQGNTCGPFAMWEKQQADDLPRYSDREREERIARGAVTPELFGRAAAETDTEFYRELIRQITSAQQEFEALTTAIDERCSQDPAGLAASPPSSSIRETLEECLVAVRNISRDRFPMDEETVGENGEAVGDGNSPRGIDGPISTREDAFRVLMKVADFFESKDPHCLLAAQVRKVVRLGRMTPAEYFSELIQDRAARDALFNLVGIKAPEDSGYQDS